MPIQYYDTAEGRAIVQVHYDEAYILGNKATIQCTAVPAVTPNVNDWVEEQLTSLTNKVTHPTNPIDCGNEVLWNDFEQAFRTAFTDTTKKQSAHAKLHALKMRIGGLDDYTAAFEHLAALTGRAYILASNDVICGNASLKSDKNETLVHHVC